jgi:GntR family transcriptional regulator
MPIPPSGSLARTSSTPAYLRIAGDLRDRINSGELRSGEMIAPERDLCQSYEVSRMTVRRALELLESEGLVHRDTTRGTFVSEPRVQLRIGSFSREVARAGRHASAELIWSREIPASPTAARMLGVPEGSPLAALQRLRRSDEEALALETTYYPADVVPGLLEGSLGGSLWDEIRSRYHVGFARTTARVEVVSLDATTSRLLETRVAAGGVQLTRQTFDTDGRCIEYAVDLYRADRVSLVIERTIESDE